MTGPEGATVARRGIALGVRRILDAYDAVLQGAPATADLAVEHYLDEALTLSAAAGDGSSVSLTDRFDFLCAQLRLGALEIEVLALAVAPELHPGLAHAVGVLHEDPARRRLSPRLIGRLCGDVGRTDADVLIRLDAHAQLRRLGVLSLQDDGGPLADRPVHVAPPVCGFLVGCDLAGDDPELAMRRIDAPTLPLGREEVVARLRAALAEHDGPAITIRGFDALELLSEAAGAGLLVVGAAHALRPGVGATLTLSAALEGRLVVADALADLPEQGREQALLRLAELPCHPVLHAATREDELAIADIAAVQVYATAPDARERAAAWEAAAGTGDLGEVVTRFRLDIGRIGEAAAIARIEAAQRDEPVGPQTLAFGARSASSRRVGEIAELLVPGPGWDDLILAEQQVTGLRTLTSFLEHHEAVLNDWGYGDTGRHGLTALFAGESGTGKTLSARVVASASGLDVYRVDLSGLFSKWVGETEKNLDRIFRAAEGSNAVLFFDEADVVFGKRTSVSSANDRYANLETAYLLQRIEGYSGVVVLATNLRSSIDDAFLRRVDIVVDFPPPKTDTRRRLWERLLPAAAPRAANVDLDVLSERFDLSGGGIRNCAMAAGFLAADAGTPIGMEHLVRAISMEYTKLGRLVVEGDFGDLLAYVR